MAVQTPSYWKEEKYQPLVEVKTAYGNKVKIPQKYLRLWDWFQMGNKEITKERFEQAIADGLYETPKPRAEHLMILRKIFVEKYQE